MKNKMDKILFKQTAPVELWANWMAFDRDGAAFIYSHRPILLDVEGVWFVDLPSDKYLMKRIGDAVDDLTEVWDETLAPVKIVQR